MKKNNYRVDSGKLSKMEAENEALDLDLLKSITGGQTSDCATDPTIHYADTVYVRGVRPPKEIE
jgi:hypothetical protein